MRLGGGVSVTGRSSRNSRCCTCATLSVMGQAQALAGISTGAWLDIEREHGGAHRGQAGAAGPGRTGIFLLWPGKTQAPAAVYHHAKRWRYGMKAKEPGELMQADHMSINFSEGGGVKEFKATCPVSKWSGLQVYSRATSRNAKRFLAYLQEQAPFPIRSLQVDGGSEFRDEFEQACQEAGIPLYVLPPKKPEYNGCVERANGTSRYEFYPFTRGP